MGFQDFWYIACESRELKTNEAIGRKILDEWIALFRDADGKPVAMQDRCLHRHGRLSNGTVKEGRLRCNYHGWAYKGSGDVVNVPSDSPDDIVTRRCAKTYQVIEQDDYVYVCLGQPAVEKPFPMPSYKAKGYRTLRLQHRFENTVTNCVENFVDIPHTTYVHPVIFRYDKRQKLSAKVSRKDGVVRAEYGFETGNFGLFSKFLNPKGHEIRHIDEFFMPNVTCVQYHFGPTKHFIITSQSVPVAGEETLVYTDLTYNYGIWNLPATPVIYFQAKAIIRQDVEIMKQQMEVIRKYGEDFQNTKADVIHTFIESVRDEIASGRDPAALPEKKIEIEFWI